MTANFSFKQVMYHGCQHCYYHTAGCTNFFMQICLPPWSGMAKQVPVVEESFLIFVRSLPCTTKDFVGF